MKIVQLIFNLTSGGAEKFTVDLCNELSLSNKVYLCVIQNGSIEYDFFKDKLSKEVRFIGLNCRKGNNIKTFVSIFKVLSSIKPDIVHAHLNTILYLYLPMLLCMKRIRFVHTLHSIAPKTIRFKWQKGVNKFFYKMGIIHPVVISENNKISFFKFYNNQNVALIENGVSKPIKTANFEFVKKEICKMKIDDTDKVFIHIASYSEAKNQNLLINVFNRLVKEGNGLVLIIIGRNFDSLEAKKIIKESDHRIHYLGTKTNIIDYLLNSDAFVLSSLWEGLPISLLEALSCGIIPVSTPAGGIPNVIKNDSLGFISKDFTEEGLYKTVLLALREMGEFDRLHLQDYFKSQYSIEICSEKYELLYKNNVS